MVASESVALDALGFNLAGDVEPGEAPVPAASGGNVVREQCADEIHHSPCLFEFVYLSRPDSIMEQLIHLQGASEDGGFPGGEDPNRGRSRY